MRIFLLWVILLGLYAPAFAQNTKMTRVKLSYEDKPLDLIFLDLKLKYGIDIEFPKEYARNKRVTISLSPLPLDKALPYLLSGTPLGFAIQGDKIVIQERGGMEETVEESSTDTPTRQHLEISGTIKDKATGEALPFANVSVRGTTNGASANVDGYFTLFDVPSDTSVLVASYIGYPNTYFRLRPEMTGSILIQMNPQAIQLQEIVVEGEKKEQVFQAATGVSQITLSPKALLQVPSIGERDLFRSLQLLPGISGSQESSSGLYVRGGTPDQNLILFDGFTVYHVDHLFGFFSAFNATAVKDIQLFKGGFDARYGGRISSVVDITGKDGNAEEFNASAGISSVSYNASVETPFNQGKGTVLLAARRSFQSNFYNSIFSAFTRNNSNSSGGLPPGGGRGLAFTEVQPNSYFYDLNAKVAYRPNKKDILSFSFYNGQDDLDNSRSSDANSFRGGGVFGPPAGDLNFVRESTDLTRWGNWGSSSRWSRRWSNKFYSNILLGYSNYYSVRDRSDRTTIVRSDSTFYQSNGTYENNNLKDFTLKIDGQYNLNTQHQLEIGSQTSWQDIRYQYTLNDTIQALHRHDQGLTTALYLHDRFTLSDWLILKGGMRLNYFGPTNQVFAEPRASFTAVLSNTFKLKGAYGIYHQMATRVVREDIQQGSRDFWLLANGNSVPVSRAVHYIGGGSYETPNWLFDVEAYHKPLQGLSEYTTRFVPSGFGPNRQLNYSELFYHGHGFAQGLDLLVQRKVGRFQGWLSYSLAQVKYQFDVYGDQYFHANQDQTHEFKLVGSYKIGRFTFSGTAIYATGKPYTAPTGYYELQLLNGSTASFFEVTNKNALRLPDYNRLDLSATYDFYIRQSKGSFGFSFFNVYNRKNVWYKEYSIVDGSLLETNVSLLGFTPSLFLNWSLR